MLEGNTGSVSGRATDGDLLFQGPFALYMMSTRAGKSDRCIVLAKPGNSGGVTPPRDIPPEGRFLLYLRGPAWTLDRSDRRPVLPVTRRTKTTAPKSACVPTVDATPLGVYSEPGAALDSC
jgi:hypothetical protein